HVPSPDLLRGCAAGTLRSYTPLSDPAPLLERQVRSPARRAALPDGDLSRLLAAIQPGLLPPWRTGTLPLLPDSAEPQGSHRGSWRHQRCVLHLCTRGGPVGRAFSLTVHTSPTPQARDESGGRFAS